MPLSQGLLHQALRQAFIHCQRHGFFRKGSPRRNVLVKVGETVVATCMLMPNRYVDSPDPSAGLHITNTQDTRFPVLEVSVNL